MGLDESAPDAARTNGGAAASPERGRDDAGDADGAGGKEEGETSSESAAGPSSPPPAEAESPRDTGISWGRVRHDSVCELSGPEEGEGVEPFRRSSRRAAAGAAEEGGADCGCGEAADGGARIDAEAPGAASTDGDAAASPERGRDDAGDADGAGGKEEGEKGGECTDNELTLPLLEATAGSSKGRRRAGSDKRPAGGEAGGADADSASSSSS